MQVDNQLWHAKHIFRVMLLLVVTVTVIFLGRVAFVPDTWGQFGWYRGANVAQQASGPVRHGGDESCRACHETQFAAHAGAAHGKVRCEACHAPVADHVADGKKTQDMPIQRDRTLCLRCHTKLAARPESFPQVEPRRHVADNDGEWSDDVCFDCHDPHEPL